MHPFRLKIKTITSLQVCSFITHS